MCSQGSLFGINKCACVTVSCLYSPLLAPGQGDIVQRDQVSFRGHAGSVKCIRWGTSQPCHEISLLLWPPSSPSPLLTPVSLSLSPSFTLGLLLSSLLSSYKNAIKISKHIEAERRVVVARGWGERGDVGWRLHTCSSTRARDSHTLCWIKLGGQQQNSEFRIQPCLGSNPDSLKPAVTFLIIR